MVLVRSSADAGRVVDGNDAWRASPRATSARYEWKRRAGDLDPSLMTLASMLTLCSELTPILSGRLAAKSPGTCASTARPLPRC